PEQVGPEEEASALVTRLKAGEAEAFELLVRTHGPAVYRVTYRLLGDADEARDVTQETFLKVFRNIHRFRGEAGLMSWVFRIAVNQAANQRRWWRRSRRSETVPLEVAGDGEGLVWAERIADRRPDPEEELIARELRRLLMMALHRVSIRFRVTLILREIEGYSYDQIGELLSISVGTVKSRIARGRLQLKREMEKAGWTHAGKNCPERLTGSDPKKTSPMGLRGAVSDSGQQLG
ncbi:MAG: sigma-70 family RNA polymerase sigma factor, partial [Acidobacteria bacterium]|nr:sigma-70 family RNA polymerase sigma factor [Acidobacteriota bacterium]